MNVKKTIVICSIVFIVGSITGIIFTGNITGLLGGAAGILPAISSLGASKRNNSSVDKPDGNLGKGIDGIGTGINKGIRAAKSVKKGNRTVADILRKTAKPIKVDNENKHSPGDNNPDSDNN